MERIASIVPGSLKLRGRERQIQIDKQSTRNKATIQSLAVKHVQVFVWLDLGLTHAVDMMFLVDNLPELGTDLDYQKRANTLSPGYHTDPLEDG